jgi:colicin import membrane protein
MKAGLTTSVVMHAALLAFGLFTLRAPHALEAADVEALPVDIVPVSDISQVQQGDKKAPMKEKASPKPTVKKTEIPNAQKVGDNDVDLKTPPTPEARPKEVEVTAAPPPEPKPAPQPVKEAKQEEPPKPKPEPVPVPATQKAVEPQPKQEVKPEPVKQTAVAENPDAESVKLPDSAPSPDARPQPPQAETAKAPDHKDADKPAERKVARQQSETKKDNTLDKVAALLNKEKPSGGGAKRSTETASLGGDRTTTGEKLTQSEMDALRGQIEKCWNIPAGAEDAKDLKVSVKFRLDRTGALEGMPQIVSGGGGDGVQRAAAESARRAVMQCAPYNLPADKYQAWSDVIVNFDPSDMF